MQQMNRAANTNTTGGQRTSVADQWHFGKDTDPDPTPAPDPFFFSDLQDGN